MKYRNSWKNTFKHWQTLMFRIRIFGIDFFSFEVDIPRNFYLLTILNLTIKNR